jgi:hypothetical protein
MHRHAHVPRVFLSGFLAFCHKNVTWMQGFPEPPKCGGKEGWRRAAFRALRSKVLRLTLKQQNCE